MAVFKGSPLGELARLRDVKTARVSSWDRTGGNADALTIPPHEKVVLADIEGAGCINHIWATHMCKQKDYLRRVVLRMKWDNESDYSVEVPLGDFFGVGHAKRTIFSSMLLQMAPADGLGFNCWFPMPFATHALIELENECDEDLSFYYYVDYELQREIPGDMGRFHAQWRRENPCDGISEEGISNTDFLLETGNNLDGKGNYVILEAEGKGHYVGCNLNIHNLRNAPQFSWPKVAPWPLPMDRVADIDLSDPTKMLINMNVLFEINNWYGEGDDMIFIDDDTWPPSLHGTGTEDYFGTAYCPAVKFDAPYQGLTLPGGPNWSGKVSWYRFHIEDPIHFQKSIRVTIEHGHNNHRSDDYSSTAYWYQAEPHKPFPKLLPVVERLPRPD
ncbi:MAG: DUF2961 domain-containing protein [Anaerolineales bacterium]|jgi:hypothetical protein